MQMSTFENKQSQNYTGQQCFFITNFLTHHQQVNKRPQNYIILNGRVSKLFSTMIKNNVFFNSK